jgi:hypothetical protein
VKRGLIFSGKWSVCEASANDGQSVALFSFSGNRNRRVASRPTPYFCPATKVCKNAFLLAEGISFAEFL